jgi:hypothetical protein
MGALRRYADDHGGRFPFNGESGEECLTELYEGGYCTEIEVLRGKIVAPYKVESILKVGGKLGPESCGWHYVPGLRRDSDVGLALFWDKAGLGHNGERLLDGGRFVWFVNGVKEYIPGERWPTFLDDQELRRKREIHRRPETMTR